MLKKLDWDKPSQRTDSMDAFMGQVQKNPLQAATKCRKEFEKVDAGYHQRLYQILAKGYAIAEHLKEDQNAWKKFIKDSFWNSWTKRPTEKNQDKALNYMMFFLVGAVPDTPLYNRAYKYGRALEPYMEEELSPDEVAAKIEEDGGIEELYEQVKAEARKERQNQGDDEDEGEASEVAEDGDAEEDEDEPPALQVEMDSETLEKVLGLRVGRKAQITVKRL